MRIHLLLFATLIAFSGCQSDEKMSRREKHRLYMSEPDLVRDQGIAVGMTGDAVEGKLGKPGYRMTKTVGGRTVSDWHYYTVTEDWQPQHDDDTGIWQAPEGEAVVVDARPRLDLTFINGTLVAIGDHARRTWTATPEVLGGADIPQEILDAARRKFFGAAKPDGNKKK